MTRGKHSSKQSSRRDHDDSSDSDYSESDSDSDTTSKSSRSKKHSSKSKSKSKDKKKKDDIKLESIKEEKDRRIEDDPDADIDPMVHLSKLLRTCKFILQVVDKENGKVRKSKQNPLETYINNYIKIVEKTTFDDHRKDILSMYKKYKKDILRDSTDWITGGGVVLTFGHGIERSTSRGKNRFELYLSTIFTKASGLYDKHYDAAASGKQGACRDYVLLETRILHYLYLLFVEVATDGDELMKLADLIDRTSEQLGITDGTFIETFNFAGGLSSLFGGDSKKTLSTVVKYVMDIARNNGFDIPEQLSEGENFEKLFDMFQKIISGNGADYAKGVIKDTFDEIKKCEGNYAEMIKIITDKIKDPEVLQEFSNHTGIEINGDISEAFKDDDMAQKIGAMISDGMAKFNLGEAASSGSIVEPEADEFQV